MKEKETISERKFIAVISYLTIIGWLVALIFHNKHETKFTKLHLQQALFLHLLSLIFAFNSFLKIFNVLVLVFWIIGIIDASMGRKKPLPLIGKISLKLFKDI